MNRSRPTLALRKETLRALSNMKLARAVGGQDPDAGLAGDLTAKKECPAAAIAPKR
jgi:hypothetical protein